MTSSNPNSPTNSPLNFRPFALTKGRKFRFMPANSVGLSKPVITQALQTGGDAIQVIWGESGGTSYALQVSTDGGSTFSALTTTSGTSYTHTGLSFPGSYTYRVQASADGSDSDWSDNVTETMVDVPAAPGGLTVTGATTSSISLSWNDTADEGSYLVESSVDGLGSWTSAGSTNQNVTTFTHTGLAESVQRYYRVTAFNKAGGSIPSSTANSWTVPAAPTGLTATTSSTTQINLAWTDVSTGNTSYKVERSTNGTTWTEIATGLSSTATSYSATGLTDGTLYYFRVRAANAARNSDYSGTATATTSVAAPSSLTATAASSTQINLAWTDNSSTETGFKVERSTDNTNWTEIVGNLAANSTTYSATGLSASTLYYFRVRAYNAGGNSSYTSSASATTQSATPTAAWSIDWSSGTPSGYTFTRASTGTYVDSSGYIASASTDVARLTHNSSGSRLGLLVEHQVVQIAPTSETTAGVGSNTTVKTSNTGPAPDNANTAELMQEVAATGTHYCNPKTSTANVDLDSIYCYSVYLKRPSSNATQFAVVTWLYGTSDRRFTQVFDLSAGSTSGCATQSRNSPVDTSSGIEDVGNGWYRCWVSHRSRSTNETTGQGIVQFSDSASPGTWVVNTYPSYTVSSGSEKELLVWGHQMEKGAKPTSYIPNTGTGSVTRSADLAHVLDSSITSWGDPGALVVHFYPPGQAGRLISTDAASTAQVGIEASTTTAARAFWSSGSTSTGTIGSGVQKAVHYFNGSTSKFCLNGGTVQSGTNNLTIANTDFVTFGAEATDSGGAPSVFSQYANCVIRKVEFYSGTLTDANLQTITT